MGYSFNIKRDIPYNYNNREGSPGEIHNNIGK